MGLRERWRDALGLPEPAALRHAPTNNSLSWAEFISGFGYNNNTYTFAPSTTMQGTTETIGESFASYISQAYQANGVVFACELARLSLFKQARFQFRNFKDGRPGDLFGNESLIPLHEPWIGGTTGDLLSMMLMDADFGGNAFVNRRGNRLVRLRPDWTTIVFSGKNVWDLDGEVIGYVYQEGGPSGGEDPIALDVNSVAHFMPVPDPLAPRRGMSWLTPVVREVVADQSFTSHKTVFMDNGATVNLSIEYDKDTTKEIFEYAVDAFKEGHEGAANAGKVLHLLGATAKPVGADMVAMDYANVTNAGVERIASAAGIHPAILGLAGGLQGSSLNQGNFAAARRLTADKTLRPLWDDAAGSLVRIIDVPARAELAADLRDVAFLREDEKDAAEIQEIQARTITTFVNSGFDSDSVIAAVMADDMSKLKHSGLLSVQLQDPTEKPEPVALPSTNGKAPNLDLGQKVAP